MDPAERPSLRSPLLAWERLPDQPPFLRVVSLHLFSSLCPLCRQVLPPVLPGPPLALLLPELRAWQLALRVWRLALVRAWRAFALLALLGPVPQVLLAVAKLALPESALPVWQVPVHPVLQPSACPVSQVAAPSGQPRRLRNFR